jgi:serine/threonine protein kinase
MNPSCDLHPTLAQLQSFDTGQLPPEEQETVAHHLEGCDECGGTLDNLPEGPLVALLRAFAGPESADGGPGGETLAIPHALVGHPRYRVLGTLGTGGMGVVYKAVHRLMDRVVALKVIDHRLTARPTFVERFRREVRAAARLAHPNIVTAYDADQAGDTHFLVMEYVAGTTLDQEVARRGPLPVAEACALVRQAALGLQHAHERGMVHRDIKPHNLLLTPGGQVKILDFGLVRLVDERGAAPSLPSGPLLGTPDYLAPEQARDPSSADIRADVYSLGCTLYHLLAGQPPFPAGTPLQKLLAHQDCSPPPLSVVREDVPEALTRLLERTLAKSPAERHPKPADLAADLARLAEPASPAPAAEHRRPSRPRLILTVAVLAAVGALSLVAYPTFRAVLPSTHTPGGGAVSSGPPPERQPAAVVARDSEGLAGPEELARQKKEVRDRLVDWLRTNTNPQFGDRLAGDVAANVNRDLDGLEAFGGLLGPGLLRKSSQATLLVGRAGALHVFELPPELAREVSRGGCRVQNYSTGDDRRRAAPPRPVRAVHRGRQPPVPRAAGQRLGRVPGPRPLAGGVRAPPDVLLRQAQAQRTPAP